MLKAVIESSGKRAYFDFCDTWQKITHAIRKVDKELTIPTLKMNNNDNSIRITNAKDEEFVKLSSLIQPNDKVEYIFIQCHRLKYDKGYKDYFLKHFYKYKTLQDSYLDYIHFQLGKIKEKGTEFSLYHDPYKIDYEVIHLFGKKVLFTSLRIDKDKLPPNVYKYELRSDEKGNICQMSKRILVNHWATILSNRKIELDNDGYKYINEEKDIIYTNEPVQCLNEYIKVTKDKSELER